jgi:hypothetical protein
MTVNFTFPAAVSLVGAIGSFSLAAKLRHFKLREKPPASRAHLSMDERQRTFRIGRWILFANGWLMLAGALILAWLAKPK